jgi:hypothetical protein
MFISPDIYTYMLMTLICFLSMTFVIAAKKLAYYEIVEDLFLVQSAIWRFQLSLCHFCSTDVMATGLAKTEEGDWARRLTDMPAVSTLFLNYTRTDLTCCTFRLAVFRRRQGCSRGRNAAFRMTKHSHVSWMGRGGGAVFWHLALLPVCGAHYIFCTLRDESLSFLRSLPIIIVLSLWDPI